jgi:ribosomal protein L25 (general stress protein Ctc)
MTTSLAPLEISDEVVTLTAQWRDGSLNPRQLRSAGQTPGTVYGNKVASRNVQLEAHQFALAYKRGVRRFTLAGADNVTAIAHQVQFHPVSFEILNIEFLVK